ncbi:MAG: hypothetical protein GC160_19295 [Acidobacteria bacterium]|nr:hypothetical protein [Acidobacteriota bacterium]
MRSKVCSSLAALLLWTAVSAAQFRGFQAASVLPPPPLRLEAGSEIEVPLVVRIRPGYHMNSNQPREEYLIPTTLSWEAPGLELVRVDYPEAEIVRYDFSEEPLSVYSGEITITTVFRVPAKVPALGEVRGSLRYQACNDKACLAPTSADFQTAVLR